MMPAAVSNNNINGGTVNKHRSHVTQFTWNTCPSHDSRRRESSRRPRGPVTPEAPSMALNKPGTKAIRLTKVELSLRFHRLKSYPRPLQQRSTRINADLSLRATLNPTQECHLKPITSVVRPFLSLFYVSVLVRNPWRQELSVEEEAGFPVLIDRTLSQWVSKSGTWGRSGRNSWNPWKATTGQLWSQQEQLFVQ